MIRKIISIIVLFIMFGFLAACSFNTAVASSKRSNIPFNTTSIPSTIPTSTPNQADSSAQAESSQTTRALPKNDNITGMRGAVNVDLPNKIPTNPSVNHAWGGNMCEAGGSVYFVSDSGKGENSPVHIARMNLDKSKGIPVTGEYAHVYGLTADDKNLYFMASTSKKETDDALYALPLNGGNERKIKLRDWEYGSPQAAGGKLYWEHDSNPYEKDNVVNIMCMNPDGTGEKQLFSVPLGYSSYFYFLATSNGLYYSCPTDSDHDDCTLFHTDLQGQNKVQLNKESLGLVDMLLFDQGNLYFSTLYDGGMHTAVNRLDENGRKEVIVGRIGYVSVDEGVVYYYGVSGNRVYYFYNGDSGDMDLHCYNITSKQDKVIAKTDYINTPVLHSIRGKTINVQSSQGLYIVGNDLYYSIYYPW